LPSEFDGFNLLTWVSLYSKIVNGCDGFGGRGICGLDFTGDPTNFGEFENPPVKELTNNCNVSAISSPYILQVNFLD